MPFFSLLEDSLQPTPSRIEIASFHSLPGIQIIGLPGREVAEARERIRSAILAQDLPLDAKKFTFNLVPAGIPKRGTSCDLAMALTLLQHQWAIDFKPHAMESEFSILAMGELGLDGKVQACANPLRSIYAAHLHAIPYVILGKPNDAVISNLKNSLSLLSKFKKISNLTIANPLPKIFFVETLRESWDLLNDIACVDLTMNKVKSNASKDTENKNTFTELKLNPTSNVLNSSASKKSLPSQLLRLSSRVQRSVLACIAGRHHLLLLGPAGSGKTSILQWVETLTPEMDTESLVHRLLMDEWNQLQNPNLSSEKLTTTPVLIVSQQIKPAHLLGGLSQGVLCPGLLSKSSGGFLFADEFLEWHRDARECIRGPLESRTLPLQRGRLSAEFPADFTLIATGNLCPCGQWNPSNPKLCICNPGVSKRYLQRLSTPFLDRMDLTVLTEARNSFSSSTESLEPLNFEEISHLKKQIIKIRNLLIENWKELPSRWSPERTENIFKRYCEINTAKQVVPVQLAKNIRSLRSRHQWIRLAHTLAAIDDHINPQEFHWHEAFSYRAETCGFLPSS